MTLEEMQAKMEIQELVGKFSNLEINVPAQMALFTKDTRVKVFMGENLAFDIHGVEELEKIFSQFTAGNTSLKLTAITRREFCTAAPRLLPKKTAKNLSATISFGTKTLTKKLTANGLSPRALLISSSAINIFWRLKFLWRKF